MPDSLGVQMRPIGARRDFAVESRAISRRHRPVKFLSLFGLLVLGSLAVSGEPAGPVAGNHTVSQPRQEQAETERHRWFMTNLVGAYERLGKHSPQWDEPAKSALSLMAAARAGDAGVPPGWQGKIATLARSALDKGCTDPLIQYVAVRYRVGDAKQSDAENAKIFRKVAEQMDASEYPASLKFYASMRAAEALKAVLPAKDPPEEAMDQVHFRRHTALVNLLKAIHDPTTPETEIYAMADQLMDAVQRNAEEYPEFWERLGPALKEHWPDSAGYDLLRGKFHLHQAWRARGTSYANEVPPEKWKLFEEGLKVAEESLTSAWNKDGHDTRAPAEMIEVCLGLGRDRPEMERWFARAMRAAPNNYDACMYKLHYLEPMWLGSSEAMLTFGRECIRNTNWSGTVPLTIVDAHIFLGALSGKDEATRQRYWLRPEVWPDLRAAYEEFLRREPKAIGWRHNYAWYAYKCQAWDDLNSQLKLLGPVNYGYFGGQAVFDQMVAEAKEHAKP